MEPSFRDFGYHRTRHGATEAFAISLPTQIQPLASTTTVLPLALSSWPCFQLGCCFNHLHPHPRPSNHPHPPSSRFKQARNPAPQPVSTLDRHDIQTDTDVKPVAPIPFTLFSLSLYVSLGFCSSLSHTLTDLEFLNIYSLKLNQWKFHLY